MKSIKFAILIALISATFLLSGCDQGYDVYRLNAIRKKFPDSEIVNVPDESYKFIIRKQDGSIWYAFCVGMNEDPYVSDEIELLPKKK